MGEVGGEVGGYGGSGGSTMHCPRLAVGVYGINGGYR